MRRGLTVSLLLFLFSTWLYGQKINGDFIYHLHKATDNITIDGILNEQSWLNAQRASDFYQVLPMDTSKAWARTDVLMTYDDKNIYLMAICYDSLPGGYYVESMRRDFIFGNNDNFLVFIDPFDDKTNGFSFGANAAGAQWDGLMSNGSAVDLSWDNKWESVVKNYNDRWIFEAAIPFKTIRYKKGIKNWGINFSRLDLKLNEKSSWTPIPRQFPTASLAFTGVLQWDKPPPDPGTNISIIPYVLANATHDYEADSKTGYDTNAGIDAKIAVTPALNLDLTVNPDFSQVEVDQQVTNLSRFELFFPERRQFFLENSDLFANFGFDEIRPFFSRRIGLNAPIQYGGRLSGKLNKDWRIGAMDIQTGNVGGDSIPVQNYAVASVQRQVFARSNISAIFINRESLNFEPERADSSITSYNREMGLEYNLASSNNLWKGKFILHKSFSPGNPANSWVQAADLQYSAKKIAIQWHHEYVGENYNAEVGYVPRRNYISFSPDISYRFFPESKNIISHGMFLHTNTFFDTQWKLTDSETYFRYSFEFLSRAEGGAWFSNDFVKLLAPFDPTNTDGDTLSTGSQYHWNAFGLFYTSTQRRLFTYQFETRFGGYFGGERANITGGFGYRVQPYGRLSIDFSYDDIQLPEPYKSTSFWLISPRLDITFTNKIFLTTFIQYNEQIDNININARFQWRFKPASDIYIVYTDNYLPENLNVKNRQLVFKMTYWYNL